LQQIQQEQQLQRQRHQDQQQQLLHQLQRPAAAAARELAADLRAQHVAVGGAAGAIVGGALRTPVIPAMSHPPPFAAPLPAPSSPSSASAGQFENEIPFHELQLGKLLGSGSFGDVCVSPRAVVLMDASQRFSTPAAGTALCGVAAASR
jgi:hypothetical protein